METGKVESVHLPSPPGVEFAVTEQGARVRARAGTVSPMATIFFIISALWTAKWGLDLARLIVTHDFTAAPFIICTITSLAGLYCAGLCLWTMIGHVSLTVRGGKLLLGNPWLLGLRTRRFDLSKVQAFSCAEKDCGLQADAKSCCCSWSSVDYKLNLESDGQRISIFTHLPREAKDWLRDRLNGVLAQKQLPRD